METTNPSFFTLSSSATTSSPPSSWYLSALGHHDNIGSEGDVDNIQLADFGGSHVNSGMKSVHRVQVLKADDPENTSEKKKGSEKKMRKPRHAFQTRSQVDILDDGYRWRKYGQKAVKNNKFPRSYYRCTYQGCSVKKQVQRLTRDEGVVVTTYEGMHSHPIDKTTDNFEHILSQMRIYTS